MGRDNHAQDALAASLSDEELRIHLDRRARLDAAIKEAVRDTWLAPFLAVTRGLKRLLASTGRGVRAARRRCR